jgi:uracil-DNA glycosylase
MTPEDRFEPSRYREPIPVSPSALAARHNPARARAQLARLMRRYIEQELMLPEAPDAALPATATGEKTSFTAPGPSSDRAAAMTQLVGEYAECRRCPLHAKRTHVVPGAGALDARLVVIGEAPGAEEDSQALPFVGPSGQLLTKMLAAIGLSRDEVFITNIVKCRPPGNRNPERAEIETCRPFLNRQLAIIRPEAILLLGKFAARTLLGIDEEVSISKLRGRVYLLEGTRVVPTFHPAYLLRTPSAKKDAWEDLKAVKGILDGA